MTAYQVLAVIPARGGSKGVPGKNVARVGGVPLVARAVAACREASSVTTVAVSTDDPQIAAVALAAGAVVVDRPSGLAGDEASSESAVRHALEVVGGEPDAVLLVQATSPFVNSEDVDQVVAALQDGADSSFTAAPFHGFLWRTEGTGINHDHRGRQRRQDRPVELLETGAVYGMRTRGFLASGHRFFGRVEPVTTDATRVLEIDEPHDLERARALAHLIEASPLLPGRDDIDAIILDFDGTQTDDRAWISADGSERVAVHRGDGLGIAALRRAGLAILILSSEAHPVVRARAAKLGVECLQGIEGKGEALGAWCAARDIDPARVLYLGNDLNDLPCFAQVGWPVAVASAHAPVKAAARVVTSVPGGRGAVREIASWILGKDFYS